MPTARASLAAWLVVIAAGAIAGCRAPQDERARHAEKTAETLPEEAAPAPAATVETGCAPLSPPVPIPSDAELRRLAAADPAALGSLSLGRPQDGALARGVKLEDGPRWQVTAPSNAWATAETIQYLTWALCVALRGSPPDAPKAHVGDLSVEWGGPLSPHASHQSGRDVDVGYFRRDDRWWADATAGTLDAARTWALVRALVTETDVEVIFVDRRVQRWIRDHALAAGEDRAWIEGLFAEGHPHDPLIRHEPQHTNHLHVRFYNPVAQHRGRVVHDLVARGVPRAPPVVVPPRRLPPSR